MEEAVRKIWTVDGRMVVVRLVVPVSTVVVIKDGESQDVGSLDVGDGRVNLLSRFITGIVSRIKYKY